MPDRSRHARRVPPSFWDHVLSHPVEVAAAAWWTLLGAVIAVGLLPDVPGISRGIDALPWPVALALAVAVGGGGLLAILGVVWPGKRLTTAWRIERTGLILAGAGWAGYTVILVTSQQTAIFTTSMALSMITGVVLRLAALATVEADTRHVVTAAGMDS